MTNSKQPRLYSRSLALLIVTGISYFVVAGISFPVLPRLVKVELGGDDFDIGLVFGVMGLGMLFMRPFIGFLADKYGRKPMIIYGATTILIMQLLHVPAARSGLWVLLLVRIVLGMGSSAMYVGLATMATELPPAERSGEIFSMFNVAVVTGFAVGPVIGEIALQQVGFDAAFGLGALFAGVCLLLGVLLPETRPSSVQARFEGVKSLLHPVAVRSGAVSFLLFGAFISFNAFVTPYAESMGIQTVRWILLSYAATSVITRLIGGRFIDTADRKLLGSCAHGIVLIGLLVVIVFQNHASLYFGAVIMAVGLSFNVPLMVVIAADSTTPDQRSRVVATVIVFGDLANSFAAFAFGALAGGVGYRGMYIAVAVMVAVAAVLYRSKFMDPVTGLLKNSR
ncbi:MAG: MFS transporter [Acidimicrobiales bacterium]|nr:MFS transporter [Acidimicrobiales bacterium]